MAEYPGAAWAGVSPNRSIRQGKVKLFIVHHYAGTQGPDAARARFMAPNDRSVSPNYQVNADGSVFEIVPPDRFRAWTTGAIDHQAVTCETQNTSGAPSWGISVASHEAIAHLIAWASKRYGFPIQRGAVADGNVVTRPGVVGHRETPAGRQTSTSCPGPSMDIDYLVRRAFEIASGKDNNDPAPVRDTRLDQIMATLPIVLKIVNTDAAGKPTNAGLAGVQLLLDSDHGFVYPADQAGAVTNVSAPYFNNGVATVGSKIAQTNGDVVTISQENLHILLRDLGYPEPGTIVEQIAVNGGGHFYRDPR